MEEEQRRREGGAEEEEPRQQGQTSPGEEISERDAAGTRGGSQGSSQPLFANNFTCSHLFRCVST